MNSLKPNLSASAYQDAGVDVALADRLIESWQSKFSRTARAERIALPLGFSGLFEVPSGYTSPVLVSSTDGVGTKLRLAIDMHRHETIGIDLVAMCVNDVIVQGAEPLFFLDYFATGKLDPNVADAVIDGIVTGCEMAGADLLGGETAEMPGMYADGEYDLAGFCVGIAEKAKLLSGARVKQGDVIIGLASSGFHSNGYSLIRKLISDQQLSLTTEIAGQSLGEVLLTPTLIYVRPLLDALGAATVHAFAHITGGGLPGNLARIIPDGLTAKVAGHAWSRAPVFNWIQTAGTLSDEAMFETFNCGIGMIAIVPPSSETAIRDVIESNGIETTNIGEVQAALDNNKVVIQ